jgi:flagellar basal body-associated protein FliL
VKRNEIALILVIVGVVVIATYAIFNALFGQAALSPAKVKTTTEISSVVTDPDPSVFNKDAINPAVNVTIGDQSNQQPFTIQN